MGIRNAMIEARKKAKISQRKLAAASGWDPGNVSKLETGEKGGSIDSVDSWMDACGMELVAVPKGPVAALEEIAGLSPEHREILLRLARVLPHIPPVLANDLGGRIRTWAVEYPPKAPVVSEDELDDS